MVDARPVLASMRLLVAVGLLCVFAGTVPAQAQGVTLMGLDMNTAGNTASTLGSIQGCYAVAWSGTPFDGVADRTIDVYVTGDTQAPIVYDAWITYDNSKVHVLQAAPTDPLIKMPGALNLSGYQPGQASFAAMYGDPPYNGIAGNGTLVRIGLDIGGSGVLTFAFARGTYRSQAGLHPVVTVPGQLAVNTACPAVVGGIAELPDAAASADSSADYVVVAGATAAGAIALALAATYTRRRRRSRID
jgi:hypothetical protein